MKTILILSTFISYCALNLLRAQHFLSNSDIHDLHQIEQQFKKDPSELLRTSKYALSNKKDRLCISLVAKTNNGFNPSQIESFGGQAHVTVNGLAHLQFPISKINKLKELNNIEFASLSK